MPSTLCPGRGLRTASKRRRPILEKWVGRGRRGLSFHMTQVLSEHDCFKEHLHDRTGREVSTRCHHCPELRNTAQHILEIYPAWANKRRALVTVVRDFLPPHGQGKNVREPRRLGRCVFFLQYSNVAEKKAERRRKENPRTPPKRQKKRGRRRRAFLYHLEQGEGGEGKKVF